MAQRRTLFHHLLWLALLSALPLTAILGFLVVNEYRQTRAQAAVRLRAARDHALARWQGFLEETGERTRRLARSPGLEEGSEEERDTFLRQFADFHPEFYNAMVIDRAGLVTAIARFRSFRPAPLHLVDTAYLREVVAQPGTSISRGLQGAVSGRWSFYIGEPVPTPSGDPTHFLILPVDLQYLSPRLLEWPHRQGEQVTVMDTDGRILMDSEDPERRIGEMYAGLAELRQAAETGDLTHRLPGLDGRPMSVQVGPVPGTPWLVAAHLPTWEILDRARWRLAAHFGGLTVFLGLWLVVLRRQTRLIAEPIRQLAGAARAQAEGRFTELAPVVGPAEIAATAEAFNRMVQTRHTNEAELRESRERLDLALRGADLGLWDWHIPSGRVSFNERWARMLGYEPGEIEEHVSAWERLVHPEDRPLVEETLRRHLEGLSSTYETEHRLRAKSGRWVWVLDRGRVVERDAQGRPVRAVGTHQDITERKETHQRLRDSESRYRLLFENMTAGFALHELICNGSGHPVDYRFLEVNPTYERLTGLRAQNLVGRTVREVIPAIEKEWIEKFGRVALTGESINYRAYVKALNRYYDTFAFAPRKGQFAVVFTEVTEKELAEQAMRETNRRYQALVNSIDGIVWEYDTATARFSFVSPRAEGLVGYPARQWLEEPDFWVNHLHPADREWAPEYCRKAILARRDHELDYRFLTADGRTVWLHDIATVSEEGGTVRLRGVMFDITGRKQAESERQALEQKIQETQKLESLGVLAGGIAHDFNNLLTGILGNANLAQLDLPASHPAQEWVTHIEAAARRAADLCRQMLAYSGRGRFVVQAIDLNQIVRELTHLLQISISKHAVMRFNLAERLPFFEADATQLRQVIMNLVINASEALQERSGVVAITTGVVRVDAAYLQTTRFTPEPAAGDYVFLEVSDNGCGMDEATRLRIFDPFFTTKFTGRGLGLAAVLGIMRSHRGALKVYSEPGKGSTFKLLFPVAEGNLAEREPTPPGLVGWRGEGRVLVVDDEETVRAVAARMLERAGFAVEMVDDPREALARLQKDPQRFTLVLLDLTMPHLSGEEVFRQIRVLRPGLKVVLMSGFNEQEAIDRFTGKGLGAFVQKPISYDTLVDAVRKTLEST